MVRIRRHAVQRVPRAPFEEQRQAESARYVEESRTTAADRKESENAREILYQLSSSPRSPSAAIFRRCSGKPTRGGNLLDSPTDMPQEIPRVFSQRSSVPSLARSPLSSLGQSFSPIPLIWRFLSLSIFPSSTTHSSARPVAFSFHSQSASRSYRAPTQPLRARPSLGFVDSPRGRRYRRIVKVSSASAGYIGRNHDGRPSVFRSLVVLIRPREIVFGSPPEYRRARAKLDVSAKQRGRRRRRLRRY